MTIDETIRPYSVIKTGTIFLVLFAISAWHSNPDEANFRRWFARQSQQDDAAPVKSLANTTYSPVVLAAMDTEHVNFGFFSVMVFHNQPQICCIGACGTWWQIGAIAANKT